MRQLLKERFPSDEEFDAFCAAWFRDIAERFAPGMDRTLKTNLLFNGVEPDVVLECISRMDRAADPGRAAPGLIDAEAEAFRKRARAEAELQLLIYHRSVLERYGADTEDINIRIKDKQAKLSIPDIYPGARLEDKYILIEKIGEGSLGSVWHAQSLLHSPRYVAIKLVTGKPTDSDVIRLGRAASVLGRLAASPYVAPLIDGPCEVGPDLHYIVLEYLAGGSLHARLRHPRLAGSSQRDDDPVAQERLRTRAVALRAILQVGEALSYAHSMGTTHRNIHPGNILFDGLGAAKITDFDSARTADRPRSEAYSHGLMRYRFSSPEKRTGTALIDARSDVYSLGMVTLVSLILTSRARPVDPDSLDLAPESLRGLVQKLDVLPETRDLLLKAVSPEPDRRFRTMSEFCTELQRSCQHILDAADALGAQPPNPLATTLRRLPSLPSAEPASGTGRSRPPMDLRRTTLRNFPFRYSGADDGRTSSESQRSQPPSASSNPTSEEFPVIPQADGAAPAIEDPTAVSPMPDAQSWADLVSDEPAEASAPAAAPGWDAAERDEAAPPAAAGAFTAAADAPAAADLASLPPEVARAAAAMRPDETAVGSAAPADGPAPVRSPAAGAATAVPVFVGATASGSDADAAFDTMRDDAVWVPRGLSVSALRQQLAASPILSLAVVLATFVNLMLLGIVVWLLGRGPTGTAPEPESKTARSQPAAPTVVATPGPAQPSRPPAPAAEPSRPAPAAPAAAAPSPAPAAQPAATPAATAPGATRPAASAPTAAPAPAAVTAPPARPTAPAAPIAPASDGPGKAAPEPAGAATAATAATAAAPAKPKVTRQLCVASDPGAAEVFVDNKNLGKTPGEQSAPRCISVPAAKFTLRLRRDGYKPFVFGVTRDSAWVTQTDKAKGEQRQVIVITPKLSPEAPANP
ncbi:MAG: protein kinase [Polyangia bacterium]